MKILAFCLLMVTVLGGFNDIAKINALKKQAKTAYNNGDYQTALAHYQLLSDSLNVKDESIELNLANAYFKVQDTTKAINTYNNLLASSDLSIKSVAHQQLGIIKNREKQFKEALSHFKESLKADPTNNDSRYNYELLKKVLEEQKKQDQDQQQDKDDKKQDQQNKDQNKEDQQNQDQNKEQQDKEEQDQEQQDKEGQESEEEKKDGEEKEGEQKESEEEKKEGEEKEEAQQQEGEKDENKEQEKSEPSFSDKLQEMKISEEKAKMILEAMKNNEIQYFQQNKRKPKKKKDPEKPDW